MHLTRVDVSRQSLMILVRKEQYKRNTIEILVQERITVNLYLHQILLSYNLSLSCSVCC